MKTVRYIVLSVAMLAVVLTSSALYATENYVDEGNKYLASGEYEKAVKIFDKAIERDPGDKKAYEGKADALENLNRYDDAINEYDKLIELDPKDRSAYESKFGALIMTGRYEELLKVNNRLMELDPDDGNAYIGKGVALYFLGRYEEAIKACDMALERKSDEEWANRFKAYALIKLKKYDEAIDIISKELASNKGDWFASNDMAFALMKRNKGDDAQRAREISEQILKGPSKDIEKAGAYANLGRKKEMLEILKEEVANDTGMFRGLARSLIKVLTEFDPYRDDPEFKSIVGQ